jgi:hypothetical protein
MCLKMKTTKPERETMKHTFPVYRTLLNKLDINGNHPAELVATFVRLIDAEYFVSGDGEAYIGVNETTQLEEGAEAPT